MDEEQKKFIDSNASELAESIRAIEFAEFLQLSKLVKAERVENIFGNTDSNYCRNLRLLEAIKDCDANTAFDDFVKILERVDPDNAPRLLLSITKDNNNKDNKDGRTRLGRLLDRLGRSSTGSYPLGMRSSLSSTRSPPSYATSASSTSNSQENGVVSSPLKEKHQATLICSASSSTTSQDGQQQLQQSVTDNSYRLALRHPTGQLPITPPTVSQLSQHPVNGSDRIHQRNMFSQTPTRPPELSLINNLSLNEEDQEERIVCWHPYAQSPGPDGGSRASSPHRCLPSYSSASSESGESSSDSVIIDQNFILNSEVMAEIARDGPNMMKVQTASRCHNTEDDYKMTARPRGKCLIVNNVNFENEIFPTRKGSDEDANRFDTIFSQLGFDTVMTRNLTADAMRAKFKELANACKQEHDALFVFILSHGSEYGIYGTDGMEVYLESEIIQCFDNRNCRAMIGKPKVFVIQACRGRSKDCGGDGETTDSIAWAPVTSDSNSTPSSQENRVPASWLPNNNPFDGKRRKHPIRTDMMLVFSCLAGFVSVRNETAGSWLGVALAYFLMKHAHEHDLVKILNKVTSDIIQRESSHGHIQSIEVKLLGWTKNFYFNPGIYI